MWEAGREHVCIGGSMYVDGEKEMEKDADREMKGRRNEHWWGMATDNSPASPVLSMRFCLVTGPAHLRSSGLENQWYRWHSSQLAGKGSSEPEPRSTLFCPGCSRLTPYQGRPARDALELLPWRQGQSCFLLPGRSGDGEAVISKGLPPPPQSLPAGPDPGPPIVLRRQLW